MRYVYSLIFVLCFVPLSAAQSYTAAIVADGATVRSGPGGEFYSTLQLRTGDKVEIFYEQGEWYAIRPPIGSFSWVSAKFVNVGTGNVGTVLADGLASRIGSDYSDDCDTVQVALKKGESVLILERRETPENLASPVWLKIAPPSGEFRWLHRSAFLNNEPFYDSEPKTVSPPIRLVRHETAPAEAPALPKVASAHPFGTERKTIANATGTTVDPFQRAFSELQRETYVVMTRPTDDDVFALLIQRAEELHQIAPTDHDLEKTYHLFESLQRTRAVRRELALRRPRESWTGSPLSPSPLSPPLQSVSQAYTPTVAQNIRESGTVSLPHRAGVNVGGFDIVGQLGEFDPAPPQGHPLFAVVDESGKIICLISPSPNLDLSPHVGQFVGINGVLGFWDTRQQGKPLARHITARSVRVVR